MADLGRCSRIENGWRLVWSVPRLWRLVARLTPTPVDPAALVELDLTLWGPVTLRDAVGHFRRCGDADLRYPIILAAEGWLMDGSHRVVSALATSRPLLAVRFPVTPAPDRVVPLDDETWWQTSNRLAA